MRGSRVLLLAKRVQGRRRRAAHVGAVRRSVGGDENIVAGFVASERRVLLGLRRERRRGLALLDGGRLGGPLGRAYLPVESHVQRLAAQRKGGSRGVRLAHAVV